ncbi:P-loop containing nucleoside triphosphate hydrolase protein, partial [Mycena floridula]
MLRACRCRSSVSTTATVIGRRFRSGGSKPSSRFAPNTRPQFGGHEGRRGPPVGRAAATLELDVNRPDQIIQFCENRIPYWTKAPKVAERLVRFGIPKAEVAPLLDLFSKQVYRGKFRDDAYAFENYGFARLSTFIAEQDEIGTFTDYIFTSILYTWAADPPNESTVTQAISLQTLEQIRALSKASDRRYPAEDAPSARRIRRKIIMHVGPTNSGKTHHALRALAAAKSGCYAGPLRLLANEIWSRLNLGQIRPLGVEEDDSSPSTILGNPKYARPCNMMTGEQFKIVQDNCSMFSCTVEMMPINVPMDVAVVDEIQMIGDQERGFAWSNVVLGLCAKEIHLCGEETAVPIVKALLKDTGDEITVREYKRLTPLVPVPSDIAEDMSNIRKGDCIVAFSRNRIFSLKKLIESHGKLRCAVVYGRLPPEIRSKQAEMFNDPDNEHDVIIGSDAIGMGLNLKIRRVIFDSIDKFSKGEIRLLSTSSVKQIAGRAGRYGLHGDNTPGYATTRRPQDMGHVSKCLNAGFTSLTIARLGPNTKTFSAIHQALPKNSSLQTIHDVHEYVSRVGLLWRYSHSEQMKLMCHFLEQYKDQLTSEDLLFFTQAPVPWRDEIVVPVVIRILDLYCENYSTGLKEALEGQGFLDILAAVEKAMAREKDDPTKRRKNPPTDVMMKLESLYKIIDLYAWLRNRRPIAFYSAEEIEELRPRVNACLLWGLQTGSRNPVQEEETPLIAYRGAKPALYDRGDGKRLAERFHQREEKRRVV